MSETSIHTFVIGDVHGRADLLDEMLCGIKRKAEREDIRYRVVFIGDIIDRGPKCCAAMDLVVATLNELPDSRLILGNHDWLPLRILEHEGEPEEPAFCSHWISETLGGMDTLRSYGFSGTTINASIIRQTVNPEHLECLRLAEPYVELEQHILLHAGLKPDVPLSEQSLYDMMWVREGFLDYQEPFEKMIVHGHTVTESQRVEVFSNRIAIDTGAYQTGILSGLHIRPNGDVSAVEAYDSGLLDICGFKEAETLERSYQLPRSCISRLQG